MADTKSWELVLGFEIHTELSTVSKMFCACPADHFGKHPNTQTCPVCLGLPGALPVPNAKAIEWCIKLGLALNCLINLHSKFDRKNYFYPDLPKGYQISQYDLPFCYQGYLTLNSGKKIRITRVHMEEDTAKLQHAKVSGQKVSLIDFNRSGVPLVEIVTEPDFTDAAESDEFLKEIQHIVRALGVSTADMEKGSMRLEANISVRKKGQKDLPKFKVEVKNVNSFRFIKKAIEFEYHRQVDLLEKGETPVQETRGFNEAKNETFSQRSKEAAHDYRYFPEPDIPPFIFTAAQIDTWRKQLPELPADVRKELADKWKLSQTYVQILTSNSELLTLFTQTVKESKLDPKKIADFLVNKRYGDHLPGSPVEIISALDHAETEVDIAQLQSVINSILTSNPKAVDDYRVGKTQSLNFLLGQVKRQLPAADATIVTSQLIKTIS